MVVDLQHSERPKAPEMTGEEMKAARKKLGLTAVQMARAIGYVGQDNTVVTTVRRYESGGRDIPPWISRLILMFERHGVPPEFLIDKTTNP